MERGKVSAIIALILSIYIILSFILGLISLFIRSPNNLSFKIPFIWKIMLFSIYPILLMTIIVAVLCFINLFRLDEGWPRKISKKILIVGAGIVVLTSIASFLSLVSGQEMGFLIIFIYHPFINHLSWVSPLLLITLSLLEIFILRGLNKKSSITRKIISVIIWIPIHITLIYDVLLSIAFGFGW